MATQENIRIELREISPKLAELPAGTPYALPKGYFDSLVSQVMTRIKSEEVQTAVEEISTLSPLLGGLKQKPTLSVPAGYFEELSSKTLQGLNRPAETRVVPMFGSNVFKYAAAAVIAGILAIGGWFFYSNTSKTTVNPQGNELVVEKQIQGQTNGVSDNEMINYLDSNLTVASLDADDAVEDINQDDIKLLLADISDQELEHFLDHDDPRSEKLN